MKFKTITFSRNLKTEKNKIFLANHQKFKFINYNVFILLYILLLKLKICPAFFGDIIYPDQHLGMKFIVADLKLKIENNF
jgi:hypothetical protein